MSNSSKSSLSVRSRFLAAAASLAIIAGTGFGVVTSGTGQVLAEAVTVAPQNQTTGFGDVVEKVSPAVVSVMVKGKTQTASNNSGPSQIPGFDDLPDNHPLKRFFREFGGPDGRDQGRRFERRGERRHNPERPIAQGSGFFISEDGYLVTNNHVVEGGDAYSVKMDDGAEYDAKLIGRDPRTDLAVLKVDNKDRKFTYVGFADDSKVRVGDWVVAVGNPFGLGGTVTAGIVSARGRDIGAGPYDDFLQIDAAVNRGNSGGPAFNTNGEVVGVNTAIFSPSGGNVGIAFAIPATTVKDVVTTLMEGKSIERGWLGVQIQPVTPEIAESIGLDDAKGAIVASAQDDSPAAKAGVKDGDVITAVDGESVSTPRELARVIGSARPGKDVKIDLWRNGKAETINVKLGVLPGDDKLASQGNDDQQDEDQTSSLDDFGMTVAPADDGKGVVITQVDPDSDAASRGLASGDVIVSVNSKEVTSPDDVEAAIKEAAKAGRKQVLVQVTRDDVNRFVALPTDQG
ncbi:Do family serine endopeptidase [Tianweitania sp. BSSL-BM11]|uniref:Probable periplasmic serine endoprotease DegP-like n=1 Tax=Tianweitania aestuarii TaxID=2814886 RepID=A0ABS5RSB6_9HYPH|nr:Do family serine endopeptidase [Tianweitania aestuarii]MBS9719906.1 Do family serine endopeptidase [Tianweitania aestuarii]